MSNETLRVPLGVKEFSKSQNITIDKIKKFLPRGSSHQVTQNVLNIIEDAENSTGILQEYFEEAFMSHTPVFGDLKVDLLDYVNGIKYVTLAANMSNRRAWEIVFPESILRLEKLIEKRTAEGRPESVNVDSHVSNYNKTDIVVALQTRMAIAPSILYHKEFHEAMSVKVNLMRGIGANPGDRVSPTVQLAAAIAVTDKTAMPVDNNIVVRVGMTDEAKSAQQNLADQIAASVASVKDQLIAGVSLEKAQRIGITSSDDVIDAELED